VRKTKVDTSVIEGGEADVSDLSSISNDDVHVGRRNMGHLCGREISAVYLAIVRLVSKTEEGISDDESIHYRTLVLRRHPDIFGGLLRGRNHCRDAVHLSA
jgi:hypothetical protein